MAAFHTFETCTEVACENVAEDVGMLEDAHLGNILQDPCGLDHYDRHYNPDEKGTSLEERLENLSYGLNNEVFDRVLKRCSAAIGFESF
ncbi:hypothetical protein Fmac_018416 [Flemingia macrophylla]|uniref:Uncharacterized protein n=1 Tax=Flemingia macrophylla TaxID=520843 RepID=A0ABD1M4Z9_9FABA